MMHSTTTPTRIPSPVGLSTLFMHSSTGLAIPGEVVALCIMKDRDRARSLLPFPTAVYRAAPDPSRGR